MILKMETTSVIEDIALFMVMSNYYIIISNNIIKVLKMVGTQFLVSEV